MFLTILAVVDAAYHIDELRQVRSAGRSFVFLRANSWSDSESLR